MSTSKRTVVHHTIDEDECFRMRKPATRWQCLGIFTPHRNLEYSGSDRIIADHRLANRVQLSTDGNRVYLDAVENAFGVEIDYAMLRKIYGADLQGDTRYSPATCIGCEMKIINGTRSRSTFPPVMSSGRTSPCGCLCGGLRA